MQKFNTKQRNQLISGNALAIEIPAISEERRAFIVVKAVSTKSMLNTSDASIMKFWLRRYEIPKTYIENDWDVSDEELVDSVHLKDILGIDQLEQELSDYLEDFTKMDVEWKCENPL
ncbi:hypothetical protein [Paenibacillus elgii]|uniref:hypothetical protein n=1 Tax=Paenibacillus elgii TaxID=189691 RepID=UPI000FD98301|nr:hypothetical protein [Paenibacillus elgii]NEN87035.1 hypothetical protein [Paenibacillus elgii]